MSESEELALRKRLSDMGQRCSELEAERDTAQMDRITANGEIAALRTKNAALADELRDTDQALGDYTVNIIRSLPEAATKLRQERDALRARVAELENTLRHICAAFPADDDDCEHTAHALAVAALRDVPSAGGGQ